MTERSLYERLGGAFAIAAVVDHFSDAIVQNPIVGQQSENPQLREWHTNNLGRLPASSSCARCGSAPWPAAPSNMQLRNQAARLWAWKKLIANSRSPPPSSTRLRPNSGERLTFSRSQNWRKRRYSQPSPRTRAK